MNAMEQKSCTHDDFIFEHKTEIDNLRLDNELKSLRKCILFV